MSMDCPACGCDTMRFSIACPACGFTASEIDGFEAWAPALVEAGGDTCFDPKNFQALAELEPRHFWFQTRNRLILWALRHYGGAPERFAEIGCGTGFVTQAVECAFPESEILGTDLFVDGLRFAAGRRKRAKLIQMDARHIPYRNHFDAIGMFDVLEHIEDDRAVLDQIWKALTPGGLMLLTVPQHRWLWSPADDVARHVRRYTACELTGKVSAAGFSVLRSTSFVALLLPVMIAARLLAGNKPVDAAAVLRINTLLNRLFNRVMSLEISMIRVGLNFPFGGSRLLVARKADR